jgi:signal peptidase I
VTEKRFLEDQSAKIQRRSRRQMRRERQRKAGGLARFLALRRSGSFKTNEKRLPGDGVPKSRRARREQRRERRWGKWRGGFAELFVTILVAVVLVFGIVRPFVVMAYSIPSESMVPTLEIGDRILANKFIYYFREPRKGDIVIFGGVAGEKDETLIKRVVGVAGDKIRVRGDTLYVNNEPQEEPYLDKEDPSKASYGPTRVPSGHIFVMGDNRGNSADSRVFGPLPLQNVEGEAFFRFWPLPKIGAL